ncbi:MAG: hypothetical protein QM811_20430 [Pirellulales bacterium]
MTDFSHHASDDESRRAAGSERAVGTWFGDLDDLDFEIEFCEAVLKRNPNHLAVLRIFGELLSRKGLYLRTLEIDDRLVRLQPDDGIARYNLACSLTRHGEYARAIAELERAIETGYDDFEHLEADPDLLPLRSQPAFADLLRRFGAEQE